MISTDNTVHESRKRGNVVTVLIPAKSYKLQCSWTKEKTLPAIEDFSCRLILMFDEITASEIQNYFGLSGREREVLVETLINKRLISVDSAGLLKPSPLLAKQASNFNEGTSFIEYEERNESIIIDLLTYQLLRRRTLDQSRFGLPEITLDENAMPTKDDVCLHFSRQYRAHLEFTRSSLFEAQRTRLYKITSTAPDRIAQIPVDVDIQIGVSDQGQLKVYRTALEKIGETRSNTLSNALEAKVADYFATLKISESGMSFKGFCDFVEDDVLTKFIKNDEFDFASWLLARAERKTGYGSRDTTAMLGPIYLPENRTEIFDLIRASRRDWNPQEAKLAIWVSADVPLWAASAELLSEFSRKLEIELGESRTVRGTLTTVLPIDLDLSHAEKRNISERYKNRIPNGLGTASSPFMGKTEFFVIPGVLAVCQYHIQVSKNSGITVPIGHITTNCEKVDRIYTGIAESLINSDVVELWSRADKGAADLLFGAADTSGLTDVPHSEIKNENLSGRTNIKPTRRILSLKRKDL